MGRPKPTLRFGNSTILERLIAEFRDFDEMLVMAAPAEFEAFPIEDLLGTAPSSVRLLRDCNPYEGAASALAQALTSMANDVAFVCSCDLPLLQSGLARALYGMLNGYEAVIPIINNKAQPLCAVYRRSATTTLELHLASAERRLTQITSDLRAYRPRESELRQIEPDLSSFVNINTPEDYMLAKSLLLLTRPNS